MGEPNEPRGTGRSYGLGRRVDFSRPRRRILRVSQFLPARGGSSVEALTGVRVAEVRALGATVATFRSFVWGNEYFIRQPKTRIGGSQMVGIYARGAFCNTRQRSDDSECVRRGVRGRRWRTGPHSRRSIWGEQDPDRITEKLAFLGEGRTRSLPDSFASPRSIVSTAGPRNSINFMCAARPNRIRSRDSEA